MHLPSRTGKVMRGPIILLVTSAPATTSQLVSRPRDSHLSHVSCMHCQTPLPKMLLSAFLSQTLQWVTYLVNSEVHPHCKNLPGPATHSLQLQLKVTGGQISHRHLHLWFSLLLPPSPSPSPLSLLKSFPVLHDTNKSPLPTAFSDILPFFERLFHSR